MRDPSWNAQRSKDAAQVKISSKVRTYPTYFGVAAAIVVIVGSWYGLRSAYYGYTLARPVPFWDQIASVEEYFAYLDGNFNLETLFRFHNEHRIATSRLIFLADAFFFDATNRLSILIVYAGILAVGSLIIAMALNVRSIASIGLSVLASLGIIWSSSQWENLSWGFQVQIPLVHLFALLSLQCLMLSFVRLTSKTRWLMLAMIADALGIFSFSTGALIGLAALALGVWLRAWTLQLLVFLAVHAVLVFAYFIGWPSHQTTPILHLTEYAMFFLRTAGALVRPDTILTAILGAAVTLITTTVALAATRQSLVKKTQIDGPLAVLMAMACFVLLEVAAITWGRASQEPYPSIASRYATSSAILILCLMAILWRLSYSWHVRSGVMLSCAALTIMANAPINAREWADRIGKEDNAVLSFINGVYVREQVDVIYPADFVARDYKRLALLQKGPFSPSSSIYRPPLNSAFSAIAMAIPQCRGSIDGVDDRAGEWSHVWGWIAAPMEPIGSRWILAFSNDKQLIGFTKPTTRRPDVVSALSLSQERVGFDLFLSGQRVGPDRPTPINLVAVFDGRATRSCAFAFSLKRK
jgi:hypothetical protein